MADNTSGLLADRRVLVTGAASGIGKAVVAACERAGADTIPVDLHGDGRITRCDVRSEDEVTSLFAQAGRQATDVVHCAGIASTAPIEQASLEHWQSIIDTNLTGSFLVGREFARTREDFRCRVGPF